MSSIRPGGQNESESNPTADPLGRVYLWRPSSDIGGKNEQNLHSIPAGTGGGQIETALVPLARLDHASQLAGQFVTVHNDTVAKVRLSDAEQGTWLIGDAQPNADGNFIFEPHAGGGRMDKHPIVEPDFQERYISASRFGEVNCYFHIDKVACYVDQLLDELGHKPLPQVIVRVNSHNAIGRHNGCCDGVLGKKSKRWLPFQGGHYRLPTNRKLTVVEHKPLSSDGEIHLGPGWRLTQYGALPDYVQRNYRCNASHNAGIIYHEYGHHLTRHTADFRGNRYKVPNRQCNIKTDLDEAYCDYLAATMMNSPHIWAFHHRHDNQEQHRRSLVSKKTMAGYDHGRHADPHDNGTILAATLWDIRQAIGGDATQGLSMAVRDADLLIVNSLVLIGQLVDHPYRPNLKQTRRLKSGFSTAFSALLEADSQQFNGRNRDLIKSCFNKRGIKLSGNGYGQSAVDDVGTRLATPETGRDDALIERLSRKDPAAIIPDSNELLSGDQLEQFLRRRPGARYSVVAVGDVMIGSRARNRTNEFGPDYIFKAVEPLFKRSSIVLGNQEGPIAKHAAKLPRNHSYRVNPKYTRSLRRAGFNVVTLANNHLLDCGRDGVIESLDSLRKHGIEPIGAGTNRESAHQGTILRAGPNRIGLLGYYWNRRTSARREKPGSAMDTVEFLADDIRRLRPLVDRLVVTVHWGVPYEREPTAANREKARLMIELGADVVIGHHPHIIQRVEVIDDRPVIYSIGNFAFGTGNSKSESLLAGIRFDTDRTTVDFFPAYVKNRDPRINYQPKIMSGGAAERSLTRLARLSGDVEIKINDGVGELQLPYSARRRQRQETSCVR